MCLAGAWVSWIDGGSLLDRLGVSEAASLFRSHGPFTAHLHVLADDMGSTTTGATFGAPESIPVLYRGAVPSGREGMSWTDSMTGALGYAWQTDGQVFTCDFEPTDFLARVHLTYEDDPSKSHYEWIMRPNGKALLWSPPWLAEASTEVIAAEHERLKRDLEEFLEADDHRNREIRRAIRDASRVEVPG